MNFAHLKTIEISLLLIFAFLLNSCASGYKKINPETINYSSRSIEKNIFFEYKYDLLERKYKKKEAKNDIKIIAVKITNNSKNDLIFGHHIMLNYENGMDVTFVETQKLYKTVKQSPASYLWYLLLSPVQLYSGTSTTNNGNYATTESKSSFPVGLIVGPGLAGGNMIAASSANKNFKKELVNFDLHGKTIKKGETVYGLIGLKSNSYDPIRIKIQ